MNMRKKDKVILFLMALAAAFLTGCSGSGKEASILSEEELESSHLEKELMEKVFIDAAVTPRSAYAGGLNSYYVFRRDASGVEEARFVPEEEYMNHPMSYGHSLEEIASLLGAGLDPGRESAWDWVKPGSGIVYMTDREGKEKAFHNSWDVWNGLVDCYSPTMGYFYDESLPENNMVLSYVMNHYREDRSLSFASRQDAEEQARGLLETLTGEEYWSGYFYAPIDETAREELEWSAEDAKEAGEWYEGEEYYGFVFDHQIDGFPLRYLVLPKKLTSGMVLDEEVENQKIDSSTLLQYVPYPNLVCLGEKTGVRFLKADPKLYLKEAYREKEPVCDVNRVLAGAKSFFEKELIIESVTINRIELVYTYYFSDMEDGYVHNAAIPFWVVQYWEGSGSEGSYFNLIFDAYTGDYVATSQFVP